MAEIVNLASLSGRASTAAEPTTALASQILSQKTAYLVEDGQYVYTIGTMPNLTNNSTINYSSSNDAKVLNGSNFAKVTNSDNTTRLVIKYGGNSGYIESGTYIGASGVNLGGVSTANVLTGQTFSSNNGIALTGTMPNLASNTSIAYESGNSNKVIAISSGVIKTNSDSTSRLCLQYTGDSGYLPKNSYVGIPASSLGNATTGNVISGATFTSQNGLKITGTMANNSSLIVDITNNVWDGASNTTTSNGYKPYGAWKMVNGVMHIIPGIGYWGSWNYGTSELKISNILKSKILDGSWTIQPTSTNSTGNTTVTFSVKNAWPEMYMNLSKDNFVLDSVTGKAPFNMNGVGAAGSGTPQITVTIGSYNASTGNLVINGAWTNNVGWSDPLGRYICQTNVTGKVKVIYI